MRLGSSLIRMVWPGAGSPLYPVALLVLLAAWHGPVPLLAQQANPRHRTPNLLVILADDHSGLWLGAAGDRRGATPHLDSLARQGVYFNHTFCNSPLCTPSRQSLITGLLPHTVGVTRLETKLPEDALTLGRWLSILGYRTAAIGKMHFNNKSKHGFDVRIDTPDWKNFLEQHPPSGGDHRTPFRPFVDPASVWLNARCEDAGLPAESMEASYFVDRAVGYMQANHDRPFAMVVSFYEPHAPFPFPRQWQRRFRADQFFAPAISQRDRDEQPAVFHELTRDDFRGIQAAYYTSLSFLDFQVGRLIQALEDSGLGPDTLVVYLSDNGYLLGQHGRLEKHCFYEPAVRVPLILRWRGHLPEGKRIVALAELVDLFPTLCHLLDVPRPSLLHGTDLVPLIEEKPGAKGHEAVFSEYPESEEAMIRTDRYKLIVGSGRRQRKDHLEARAPLSGPYQRLYDLDHDPDETTDLSEDPRHAALVADLVKKLHERLVSTRQGLEPIPSGLSPIETIYWCLTPRDK
jgi:arylsulfatase A-like enzyme